MTDTKFNPGAYWEDRLQKIKGLEGVGFKKLGSPFNHWAYKARKAVFLSEIKKITGDISKQNVLDIGSGTGFYVDIWKRQGAGKITGIDITQSSVSQLKVKYPEYEFHQDDIGSETFKTDRYGKYDVISCMDVLFHIIDDKRFEKAIENIANLLTKNGIFIYSALYLRNRDVMRGESQVCRTYDYLQKVFEKNGLQLVVYRPFLYLTNKPLDSRNPLMKAYWYLLENSLYVAPFLGHLFGPFLYPIERMLVNSRKDGPTTEFTVYKKTR
jgi:2-polyprenyl-3-methyl-5-hydroxy-6-metoxy-1,4-benzoquinol methylase